MLTSGSASASQQKVRDAVLYLGQGMPSRMPSLLLCTTTAIRLSWHIHHCRVQVRGRPPATSRRGFAAVYFNRLFTSLLCGGAGPLLSRCLQLLRLGAHDEVLELPSSQQCWSKASSLAEYSCIIRWCLQLTLCAAACRGLCCSSSTVNKLSALSSEMVCSIAGVQSPPQSRLCL